jgi:hypothetical protein
MTNEGYRAPKEEAAASEYHDTFYPQFIFQVRLIPARQNKGRVELSTRPSPLVRPLKKLS